MEQIVYTPVSSARLHGLRPDLGSKAFGQAEHHGFLPEQGSTAFVGKDFSGGPARGLQNFVPGQSSTGFGRDEDPSRGVQNFVRGQSSTASRRDGRRDVDSCVMAQRPTIKLRTTLQPWPGSSRTTSSMLWCREEEEDEEDVVGVPLTPSWVPSLEPSVSGSLVRCQGFLGVGRVIAVVCAWLVLMGSAGVDVRCVPCGRARRRQWQLRS